MTEHERTPIQIMEGYFARRMQEGALRARTRTWPRAFSFSLYFCM